MIWVHLLQAVLGIAEWLAKKSHDKQLIDAGAAQAIAKYMEKSNARIQKAVAAGRRASDSSVPDPFTRD